jgi:hypothetical protein
MNLVRHPDWIAAGLGNQSVMMNTRNDKCIGLNRVGSRIWALMETPTSPEELCAQLLREFDVTPQACRTEVDAFLDELLSQGAVIVDGTRAASKRV